ncbi:MAG: hypothetical protein ABIZ49_00790 [Opitutaceae bacterium]
MNNPCRLFIDYHLIAQAQAAATGQMVHTLASLISSYIGYAGLLQEYPELQGRITEIEHILRAFCRTGKLPGSHHPFAESATFIPPIAGREREALPPSG